MMKNLLLMLIKIYSKVFSPVLNRRFGNACRFYPTCSTYAVGAIEKYGVIKGVKLSIARLLKCHPLYHGMNYDPVP